MGSDLPVVAAGGLVWRRDDDGKLRLLVVHRPKYDDWSFPKGKLEPSEHVLTAAVREIAEETGCGVRVGRSAGQQRYLIRKHGSPATKLVHYWTCEWTQGAFHVNSEVDEAQWVSRKRAGRMLSYTHDRDLLASARRLPGGWLPEATVIVLRHAPATKRRDWDGDDNRRPLTGRGAATAELLVEPMRALGVDRVLSSDAERCQATVRPTANALGLKIHDHPEMSERGFDANPKDLRGLAEAAWRPGRVTLVCSHRPVLAAVARELGIGVGKYAAGDFVVARRFSNGTQTVERFSAP